MVYDTINPSDAYTMESDDPVAAAVACMLLGEGAYALRDAKGDDACPFFLFGGDPDAWLREAHGVTVDEVMSGRREKVAEALASVLIGGMDDREVVASATARMSAVDAASWLAERYDKNRTSMNSIGSRAHALARQLRNPVKATNSKVTA